MTRRAPLYPARTTVLLLALGMFSAFAPNAAAQMPERIYEIICQRAQEGETIVCAVTLVEARPGGVTLTPEYAGFGGSPATAGTDYTPNTEPLVFSGEVGQRLMIEIETIDDIIVESDEAFSISFGSQFIPTEGGSIPFGIIVNDDTSQVVLTGGSAVEGEAITFTITLGAPHQDGLTVTPIYPGIGRPVDTAEESDWTPNHTMIEFEGNADETKTFTVMTTADSIVEGDETFQVDLSPFTIGSPVDARIEDDDSAAVTLVAEPRSGSEGETFRFTATLDADVEGGLRISPTFPEAGRSDTAVRDADYRLAGGQFDLAGMDDSHTFSIEAIDDAVDEPDESFTVGIEIVGSPAAIVNAIDIPAPEAVTILDNDASMVSIEDASAEEGGVLTFTVTLNTAVQDGLTVTPAYTDGTATADSDYTPNTAALSFAGTAGETRTFTVATIDDDAVEPGETFTVGLMVSGSAVSVGMTDTAIGTIRNNDAPPTAMYAAPDGLTVGVAITPIIPGAPPADVTGYAVQSGALPPGLTLDGATGGISGTPTTANADMTTVTIRLTDARGNVGDVHITFPAVGRGAQTLTGFAYSPVTVEAGGPPPILTPPTVTPEPGGALSYAATPGSVCTVGTDSGALTLSGGAGVCTITATAAQTVNYNENTAAATVTVTDRPLLAGLTISPGRLSPSFDPGVFSYTASVDGETESVTVTPAVRETIGVTITVNGDTAPSGSGRDIDLDVGVNPIIIVVTRTSDNAMSAYVAAVTRGCPGSASLCLPTVRNYAFTIGEDVDVVLPEAVGTGALTYSVTGAAMPAGLTFTAADRALFGTPTAKQDATAYIYRVTDGAANRVQKSFTITVEDELSSDAALAAALNRVILPEVSRAITDEAMGAISRRVSLGLSPASDSAFSMNGHSPSGSSPAAHFDVSGMGDAMDDYMLDNDLLDDGTDVKHVLGGAEFVRPLTAAGGPAAMTMALWGVGGYRSLGGEDEGEYGGADWDGDLLSAGIGMDARVKGNMLAGGFLSWHRGDLEYSLGEDRGDYEVDMVSAHPYLGWRSADGLGTAWAALGYGRGEIEISATEGPGAGGRSSGDLSARSAGIGGSYELWRRGETIMDVMAEAMYTDVRVDGDGAIGRLDVKAGRVRMGGELSHTRELANGDRVTPSAALGLRYDGGDGRTGSGAEAEFGMCYGNSASGVEVEGKIRGLLGHSGDYEEWGLQCLIRLEPDADDRGLSFNIGAGYGDTDGGAQKIRRQRPVRTDDGDDANDADGDYGILVDASFGYGVSAPGWLFSGHGTLIPYTEMTSADNNKSYCFGLRWKMDSRLELNLMAERSEGLGEGIANPVENTILFEGAMRF